MQFKHPEILYFLFFLLVPVLVHLFQLRRFKKEYFTNVAFLQNIIIQTRKSSKIKKWLLLISRLILLFFLIFAFAQPYYPGEKSEAKNQDFLIVIDNSFSMEAKGSKGSLLKRSVQELLEEIPSEKILSIYTLEEEFESNELQSFQTDLQKIDYAPIPFSIEQQSTRLKLNQNTVAKDILFISDGQNLDVQSLPKIHPNNRVFFYFPETQTNYNISIDSLFIKQTKDQFYEIGVTINRFGAFENQIPLTIYNEKQVLVKQQIQIKNDAETFFFTLPKTEIIGRVVIEDQSLSYDNVWYFNIDRPRKSKVLSLGDDNKSSFMAKIFTSQDFDYQNVSLNALDYQFIESQDAIILNELTTIPEALQNNLKSFVENGGQLVIIPQQDTDLTKLNTWLKSIGNIKLKKSSRKEKLITKINFNHPLYYGVFEKKIDNFQYPNTLDHFVLEGNKGHIIEYEDQSSFLTATSLKNGIVYVFANPISTTNSNFQKSPLIVPTFFKMGQNIKKNKDTSYKIGQNTSLIIEHNFQKEEIVSVSNDSEKFIPIQKIQGNKMQLTFLENPKKAGNFKIESKGKKLENMSFNYAREESNVIKESIQIPENIEKIDAISKLLSKWETERNPNELWKWFLWGTLLFLIVELLIQKLIK